LEYTFKHGLTYQVTYNSLLQERRRALHARTVAALEALYPDRLAEQVERLAHHAFRSEVWPEAVAYLHQAGTKAMARSAYGEALGFFQQALSALAHLPENMETLMRTIDILVELGPALMATKGFTAPEVEASYNRARGLCDRVGGSPQLFPVLWGLWMFNQQRGQTETAQELGEQLLTVAEREGDPSLLLQAHHALWTTLQQHRSHAFRYGGHDPGVCCRNFLARTLWLLGYPDQALQSAQEALSLARELSQPLTTALALNYAAWTHYHRGEREDAAARAEGVVALAREQGFSVWMAHGSMLLGRLMVEERRGEEGIAQLHRGLAAITRQGVGGREVFFLCLLADAYGKQHQTEKALEVLAEALAKTETHIERYYEPELHRLRGELLADVASQDAQTCFRQAIDVARRQSAKSLELRALISLSRLWRQQGKKEAVREILGETYGWFTEGFDTADLKEAKALLEELS
ncbi:MAG: tetratricopeptide repeat protein, partial [Candidatus Methylomirabilia bacterium]